VEWMAVLVGVAIFLGLRDRTHGGSTHVTILVVTCLTLAFVFLFRLGH
jgi:hypothetical protein